jgi:hypothetical protein
MNIILVTKLKSVHSYEISDEFWNKIKPLLPSPEPKKKAGRPRENDKKIMNRIFGSVAKKSFLMIDRVPEL